jgi:hypothetical protein
LENWVLNKGTPKVSKGGGGNNYRNELNSNSTIFLNNLIDAFNEQKIHYHEALNISGYKSKIFDKMKEYVKYGGL